MMIIRNATRRHEHKHSLLKCRRPHTYSDISIIFKEIEGALTTSYRRYDVSRYRHDIFSNVEDLDDDLDQKRTIMNEYLVLMTPSFLSDYSSEALR